MDYNTGLWAGKHLEDYYDKFTADSVDFLGLKWTSDDDKTYYSILVSPCGYVFYELMGNTMPEDKAAHF